MKAIQSARTVPATELCPVVETIRKLGSEAKLIIVRYLGMEGLGFNELLRATGLNSKTLSYTLKALESDGIILREVISTRPFKVHYSLTPKGHDLGPALDKLGEWGRKWLPDLSMKETISR
jgi:DNA-binding HxlR family transcriptional regulator